MDPKKFLNLSKKLLNKKKDESSLRTSVSRSYYAVYNYLSKFLKTKTDIPEHKNAAHRKMSLWFDNTPDQDLKTIGKMLDSMSSDRQDADYIYRNPKADFSNDKLAKTNIERSELVFDKFKKLINSDIGIMEISGKLKTGYDRTEVGRPTSPKGKMG